MSNKPHILVVEDEPLVSEVVATVLSDDYDTTVVETSAAAMESLAKGGIDLMLLDCTLPGGIDEALVPTADGRGVPVVFMSGDPRRVDSLAKGQRPFIAKPFTLTDLLCMVENTIAGTAPIAA